MGVIHCIIHFLFMCIFTKSYRTLIKINEVLSPPPASSNLEAGKKKREKLNFMLSNATGYHMAVMFSMANNIVSHLSD